MTGRTSGALEVGARATDLCLYEALCCKLTELNLPCVTRRLDANVITFALQHRR